MKIAKKPSKKIQNLKKEENTYEKSNSKNDEVTNMSKILIIEDDTDINNMISTLLKINHFEVVDAYSGTEGLLLHTDDVDLILLDLMLPGRTGEEIIRDLQKKKRTPIIVMSAIGDLDKKLDLFKLGADDYITKPFANEELLARIEIQLRHSKNNSPKEDILHFKDIELNTKEHSVKCNTKVLNLSKKEFEILRVMMETPTKVFSKNNLIRSVWDDETSADDNTLNVHMSTLRNKLKRANANEEYIETVWSIGYRLKN